MRYLEKYNTYLIEKLLESILVTTKEFKDIINDMPADNKISDILHSLIIHQTDIKTNYNFLDSSVDKNDEITFLPDSQYQRFLSKGEDITTKTKSTSSVGRVIRQILKDNGYTQFTDSDIEKFVNSFKATWNKKHGITNRKIEFVKGKDILKWYNVENYNSTNGTLGNSCMRYTRVNHFMNIYAENPEKISMVVLTEDNKLLARALFWKLDEVDYSNSEFYLDRIYAEQDSDVDFVYDWVLENLPQKNMKLISHKNGSNDDLNIKIFLNKTTFEHYPYADSFNYLYQKIDERNKLTGDGYVSNVLNESKDVTKHFVVSLIRNHREGYPNIITHNYSNMLEAYILIEDAVWDYDSMDYVPISMCVMCKFTNTYIYKPNAVYSEYMQDWISKSDAIETEKFGLVHKNSVVVVVTEYNGKYDNPIDFIDNVDVSCFKVEEVIVGEFDYGKPEYALGLPFRKFSKDLLEKDLWGEWQIKFGCFEFFQCGDYNESIESLDEFSPLCINHNGRAYLRKEDAELFGFTPLDNHSKFIAFQDLKSRLGKIGYTKYVGFINKANISKESRDYLLLNASKVHNNLLKYSSDYRINYQIDEQLVNMSVKDLHLEWFEMTWSELMKNEISYNETIKKIMEYYDIEFEKFESLMYNLIAGISFFYLIFEDSFDSTQHVIKCIDKLPKLKYQLNDIKQHWSYFDVIEITKKIFRDYIMWEQKDIQNEKIQKLANKYNCTDSNLKKFIRGKINTELINPFV